MSRPSPSAPSPQASASSPGGEWIARSNANAQVMLEVLARFSPETAGFFGVDGLDEEILDLEPGIVARSIEATEGALTTLRRHLASERDAAVRQDLEILIHYGELQVEGARLSDRLLLPYFGLGETIFQGMRALLDEQVPPARRAKAIVRLRRYAGQHESGRAGLAKLAEDRIREKLGQPGLLGPYRGEVEKDLTNGQTMVEGIAKLFEKFGIHGHEEAHAALEKQLAAYDAFVRQEVLPRARSDFRQPAELYAHGLLLVGVDLPLEELTSRARVSFREIQNEMQSLAPLIAGNENAGQADYRRIIRDLKKRQLVGEGILPHYEARNRDLERIIREQDIITLPERPLQIRLASEAESAAIPAPNMRPPRLLGNTGERGTFVLPLSIPAGAGKENLVFDDFTYEASSWTLSAHEARPGHELQFASMVEKGVSITRALFAFNSVNAEGWGLYAEAEMKPYLPLEGQIVALQHRLLRAARAFLDPGMQDGSISKEDATLVLTRDVVLSDAMALQEVERYTFRAPGQATSYFCGYVRLMALRTETERLLGERFRRRRYHDFILAQGLLPPSLLRKAVLEEFVPSQRAS